MSTLPPFELQLLIANAVDLDSVAGDERGVKHIISAVETLEDEVYLGCYDGTLLRFALPNLDGALAEAYIPLGRSSTPNGKAVQRLQLLPHLSKILVQTDGKLYFFSYPGLDLIQTDAPLKNAISFCLDERPLPTPKGNQIISTELCVIKRGSITLYTVRDRAVYRKDLPLGEDVKGPVQARRLGKHLCLADSELYYMVDLEEETLNPLLPISQVTGDLDGLSAPSISVVDNREFLVMSWTGSVTLGVFLTGSGDPTGRLFEYPDKVTSVSIGTSNAVALLKSGELHIHQLLTGELTQVVARTSRIPDPICLDGNKIGTLVPSTQRRDRLRIVNHPLGTTTSSGEATRPAGKQRPSSRRASRRLDSNVDKATFSKSRIIVRTNNSLYSMVPRSRITQTEELISAHKLKECMAFLDKRPDSSSGPPNVDDTEELRYLQQRLGYRCFTSTLFEDAGTRLFRGNLDPRLLISHFPDLVGSILDGIPSIPVYAGLCDIIPADSIEDVIADNLVKNYSPHLSPNTRSAPSTSGLREILNDEGRTMLREYLRKWRTKSQLDDPKMASPEIDMAVDTVLLRLYAEKEQTDDIRSLVNESISIVLEDVEAPLIRFGQYGVLCQLYERDGQIAKLVQGYARIVDGEWTEPEIGDGLDRIYRILKTTSDRGIISSWKMWFVERDTARGLELLLSSDSDMKRSGAQADDHAVLEQLQRLNDDAAFQYLEYLVLQKRDRDPKLHTKLAKHLLSRACQPLDSAELRKRTVTDRSNTDGADHHQSLLSSTINAPSSESRLTRLKLLFFLQSSSFYDTDTIMQELESLVDTESFGIEKVIVHGKLGNHDKALSLLVEEYSDYNSAELYCSQLGEVISPKILEHVNLTESEINALSPWQAYYESRRRKKDIQPGPADQNLRIDLVNRLLRLYLRNGSGSQEGAARLLMSQSSSFEPEAVLELVPPEWPLQLIAPFLNRHLRTFEHEQRDSEILKALTAGRNLEVAEFTWHKLRAAGAVVEESDSESEGGPEPTSFNEKVGLHVPVDTKEIAVTPVGLESETTDAR